ncbi:MAG: glycosyltransferase [Eubacterium sp.]|nr:glycosyltransferase [Eubacterium sp.]
MKKVTIIVPCHNSVKYLDECWQSILNQTIGIENLQVIMVDDASTDDTWEYLKRYEKIAPESVYIIHLEENMRQGGARNIALEYAEGEYIRFLDSDDIIPEGSTERLYLLAKSNNVEMIQFESGDFVTGEIIKNALIKETQLYNLQGEEDCRLFLRHPFLSCTHHMRIYKAEFLKRINPHFAEHRIFEEPLFVYPLFFYVKRFMFLKEVHYRFRIHAESTVASEGRKKIDDLIEVCYLLMDELKARNLKEKYHDEIAEYFYKNCYFLTLYNLAYANADLKLEEFKRMQERMKSEFGDWKDNEFLAEHSSLYEGIDKDFQSIDEIREYGKTIRW